ncbi:MAG: benzoate-CoA ligase family protein [Solirubrobacterales bacterium]|nr:benzoate-CoA ligase family protein [Solirubrobacterales bacterium]
MNASTLLDANLEAGREGTPALLTADGAVTYGALAGLTGAVVAYLTMLEVEREQRVLMILDDSPAFPAVFLGAMRMGAVPVPVNPMDRVDNYAYYLDDSYAKVLFVEASLLPALEATLAARPALHVVVVDGDPGPHASFAAVASARGAGLPSPADTHREDMAFWLYSSGSTGRPKGVVHAHADIAVTVENYARNILRIDERDICYSTTKLFHAYGLGNSLSFPLSVGARSTMVKGRSVPDRIFETVGRVRPTLFFSVPALYAAMVKAPGGADVDFSTVRACVSAAEALPAAVLSRWQAMTGVTILDGIGSTEMLHIYCSNTLEDVAPGTSGRAVPGYALRVVDEHGLDVDQGHPGDLMVRGESCAAYYWHQRAKTRFSMRGEWFHTGDRYVTDGGGRYVYQGRSDDMIKVGGLWVSPADVEACLVRHEAVSEAAVIGVRIEDVSRIKAFVICSQAPEDHEALADELRQWCKGNLRRYEYPHVIEFVEDLPRTPTGKVQRFLLREAEEVQATLAGTA